MKTVDIMILVAAGVAVAAMVKLAKAGTLTGTTTGTTTARKESGGSGLSLPWSGFNPNQYYNVWGGAAVSGVVSADNPYGAVNEVDAATLGFFRDGM